MKKVLIITRCSWTLLNFRQDYIKFLKNKNFKITVACDYKNSELLSLKRTFPKVIFLKISFLNKNRSFLKELIMCFQIIKLFKYYKFDVIHNFTIRPVIYSSIFGKIFSKSKIVNSITGLGHIFNNKKNSYFKILINFIYLISDHVIFQNKDDFIVSSYKILNKKIRYTVIFPTIKNIFKKKSFLKKKLKSEKYKKIKFLMYCRLIEQKGVREYFMAAQIIKKKYKVRNVEFKLIGNIDLNNPSSLKKNEIILWKKQKILKIFNHTNSILNEIIKSHIVCLPSYGEGMPASLLEALYLGKGIITTNVNGCREIVKNNYNGYLIEKKNYHLLANKFLKIINNVKLIKYFGKNSKIYFNEKFSSNPYEKMLRIINSL